MQRTLVLGAGFGGLTVAHDLGERLGDAHETVLVDGRAHFIMGLRKPWAIAGIEGLEGGQRDRAKFHAKGVRFVERRITRIDPAARSVHLGDERLDGDFMVVALGAEPRPDLVPGLQEHGHDLYDPAGIPGMLEMLARFRGGTIQILIAGGPYKCPPAPFETAMLLDERLRRDGLRERTRVVVNTFQPILLPNAGRAGSDWLGEQLTARGIEWHTGRAVERVEAGRVVFADGADSFDVLIGVPPHRPPDVIDGSGLSGSGPWVAVDRGTLATPFERVYAIGDVTQIPLANGLPLPKAGLFAELEGQRVAAEIAASIRGEPAPPPFDGNGYCFIELGRHAAGRVEGDFFATPEPRVRVGEISAAFARDKRRFEAERLARWFGG